MLQTANLPEFNSSEESWEIWKEKLEIHFLGINCTQIGPQKRILLKSIGSKAYTLIHSLCDPISPLQKSYNELIDLLCTHYTPQRIIFRERKIFMEATKADEENVSEWYAKVKTLALKCKFQHNLDAFILNKFIAGLPERIFEKLCEEDETLNIACSTHKFRDDFRDKIGIKEGSTGFQYYFVKNKQHMANKKYSNNNNNNAESPKFEVKAKKKCNHCGWKTHNSMDCRLA